MQCIYFLESFSTLNWMIASSPIDFKTVTIIDSSLSNLALISLPKQNKNMSQN